MRPIVLVIPVLGVPILVGLGAFVGRFTAPRTTAITQIVVEAPLPPPLPSPAPPPLAPTIVEPPPQPSTTRASCPPPRTDATRVTPPTLPEAIAAIYAAPTNAGWIVAYNHSHAYLSTDAGASFKRVLDGPGRIRDVGIDCFGRAIVVRTDGVGIRDGQRESWRALRGIQLERSADFEDGPDARDLEVLGGGPDIVVAGIANVEGQQIARLAISSDHGATWSYRDFDNYFEGAGLTGRQHEDGSLDVGVIITDCDYYGLDWYRVRNGRSELRRFVAPNGHQIYGDTLLGYGDFTRWALAANSDHAARVTWPKLDDLDSYPRLDQALAIPAPYPVLVGDGAAYRVTNGKVRKLPWAIAGEAFVMDRAGRLWSVVCGQPHVAGRTLTRPLACADE